MPDNETADSSSAPASSPLPPPIPMNPPGVFHFSGGQGAESKPQSKVAPEVEAKLDGYFKQFAAAEREDMGANMKKMKYYRNLGIAVFVWLLFMIFGLSMILRG